MSNFDRILIINILGPEIMGIYAVGVKVALILALVVGSIRMAWLPVALEAIQTKKGKSLRGDLMVSRYQIVVFLGG